MRQPRHPISKYVTLADAWSDIAPDVRETFEKLALAIQAPGPHAAKAVRHASTFADELIEMSEVMSELNPNVHACDEELDVALDVICAALELLAIYEKQR